MSDKNTRANFMTSTQREALGNQARTHQNCIEACKVGRPGKTAQDKARRERAPVAKVVSAPVKKKKK